MRIKSVVVLHLLRCKWQDYILPDIFLQLIPGSPEIPTGTTKTCIRTLDFFTFFWIFFTTGIQRCPANGIQRQYRKEKYPNYQLVGPERLTSVSHDVTVRTEMIEVAFLYISSYPLMSSLKVTMIHLSSGNKYQKNPSCLYIDDRNTTVKDMVSARKYVVRKYPDLPIYYIFDRCIHRAPYSFISLRVSFQLFVSSSFITFLLCRQFVQTQT